MPQAALLVALSAATLLALAGCGTPNACLTNRYDGSPPQIACSSGVQLPGGILRDTDPQSTPLSSLQPTYLPPPPIHTP